MAKIDSIIETYRQWQGLLAINPSIPTCKELEDKLWRDLDLASGFDAPDLERLHREAFPDPAARPVRLLPHDIVDPGDMLVDWY